jgi:hypothetical protein
MMTTEKIYVGINDERIEATGELLEEVLQLQAESQAATLRHLNKAEAKATAKAAAQAKLAALGLTVEDLQALGL